MGNKTNPRYANGSLRTKNRRRLRAEERPCWICQLFGRNSHIDYSLPPGHPMSFEVDELIPVSRYWLGGYRTPEQCANDYRNLASTHRCCNQWRGNKTVDEVKAIARGMSPKKPDSDPLPQPWGL
ncbi:MAG: hypothetical protein IJI68_12190 [Eggerthellaceae bacterium]|nr:hypothetical protein [Eggerthellaceae bacterium]